MEGFHKTTENSRHGIGGGTMMKKPCIRVFLLALALSMVCTLSPLSAWALVRLPENQQELLERPMVIAVVEVEHIQEKMMRGPLGR